MKKHTVKLHWQGKPGIRSSSRGLSRLSKLTLIIGISMCIAIGAARQIGARDDQPRQFSFNPPNCNLPCLVGFIPGKTTYLQVGRIIESLSPHIKRDAWGPYFTDYQGAEIHIQLGDSSTNLTFVTLLRVIAQNPCCNKSNQLTTIGELLNLGYVPGRVFRVRYAGAPGSLILYIVFNSHPTLIAAVEGYQQLTPLSPITSLIEMADGEPYSPEDLMGYYDTHADEEIAWYGFATTDKYLSASTKK